MELSNAVLRHVLVLSLGAALAANACGGSSKPEEQGPPPGAPPLACSSDKDCRADDLLCDTASKVCVECLTTDHCAASELCLSNRCVGVTACKSSRDCDVAQVCSESLELCVDCETAADCDGNEVCVDHLCQRTCQTDKDCRDLGLLCAEQTGHCVDCTEDEDCSEDRYCEAGVCAPDRCVPGAAECSGGNLVRCNAAGSAYETRACANGCSVDEGGAACNGDPPRETGGSGGKPSTGGASNPGQGGTNSEGGTGNAPSSAGMDGGGAAGSDGTGGDQGGSECVPACMPGTSCVDGACVGSGDACLVDGVCPDDQVCDSETGECVECVVAGDCADGEECLARSCSPINACADSTIVLVQASGVMFDSPALDATWFDALAEVLTADSGPFGTPSDLSFMTFYSQGTGAACLQAQSVVSGSASPDSVRTALEDTRTTVAGFAIGKEAPLPEALLSAASALTGARKTIVLIYPATSPPDTCMLANTPCNIDPVLLTLQSLWTEGVRVVPLALGAEYSPDSIRQIANAGAGQPIQLGATYCGAPMDADYTGPWGSAAIYHAMTTVDVAATVGALFDELRSCSDG